MVADCRQDGLIITTSGRMTAPLEELIAACNWPVLSANDARHIMCRLAIRKSDWLLYWMENGSDVAPTATLIATLRERGEPVNQIVIAYWVQGDHEPALRAAGAQAYLPICGDIATAVQEALWPLLGRQRREADAPRVAPGASVSGDTRRNLGSFPELSRPP